MTEEMVTMDLLGNLTYEEEEIDKPLEEILDEFDDHFADVHNMVAPEECDCSFKSKSSCSQNIKHWLEIALKDYAKIKVEEERKRIAMRMGRMGDPRGMLLGIKDKS